MSKFSIFIFFMISGILSVDAQKINQLDENGKRHGIWKKKYENTNQIRYEGAFEHGKEVGTFKFYKPSSGNQPTAIKEFSKEKDTVAITYFTSKGKVISKGKMLDKKRTGNWTYYHQDGASVMMKEQYQDGLLEGPQITYFKSGKKTEEVIYKKNRKEGKRFVYSEKGDVLKEFMYVNDKLQGPVKFYEPDGTLSIEGMYKNDKKDGIWKYYLNGKLKEEKKYPLIQKK